jgi:transposase InsO family protein
MSQPANSYDNSSCESFIKTLIEKILTTTGATVRFFLPTGEKASTVLLGEGTQTRSLPRPHPCLKNQRDE